MLRSGKHAGYTLLPTYVVTKGGQHSNSPLVEARCTSVLSFYRFRPTGDRTLSNAFRVLVAIVYLSSVCAAGRCPRSTLLPAPSYRAHAQLETYTGLDSLLDIKFEGQKCAHVRSSSATMATSSP